MSWEVLGLGITKAEPQLGGKGWQGVLGDPERVLLEGICFNG